MSGQDGRPALRAEIQRLATTVPIEKFQGWSQQTAVAYKKECSKAMAMVRKAGTTEVQLTMQLNKIKGFH
jgi:hypothetical protein